MKKILFPILALLVTITSTFAQSKVGYVEYDLLISMMPEVADVQAQIQSKGAEYQAIIQGKQTEMQQIQESVTPDMDPTILAGKQRRYQNLQQEIQEFSYTAQQKLEEKEVELVKPIYAKLDAAIGEVAIAKGYDYVMSKNNAGGYTIIFSKNTEDNLTQVVADKLGLKAATVAPVSGNANVSILVKP